MCCPLNGKLCLEGRREDFHRDENDYPIQCRWWVHLYGKDPQTEKVLDQFDCAVSWLPITTIETSQMSRFTAASTDKVANAVVEGMGKLRQTVGDMTNAFLHMAEKNQEVLDMRPEVSTIEIPTNGKMDELEGPHVPGAEGGL